MDGLSWRITLTQLNENIITYKLLFEKNCLYLQGVNLTDYVILTTLNRVADPCRACNRFSSISNLLSYTSRPITPDMATSTCVLTSIFLHSSIRASASCSKEFNFVINF